MKRLIFLAILCSVATRSAQSPTPVPKTTAVPNTADSYAFMSAGHVFHPIDRDKAGYAEESSSSAETQTSTIGPPTAR